MKASTTTPAVDAPITTLTKACVAREKQKGRVSLQSKPCRNGHLSSGDSVGSH